MPQIRIIKVFIHLTSIWMDLYTFYSFFKNIRVVSISAAICTINKVSAIKWGVIQGRWPDNYSTYMAVKYTRVLTVQLIIPDEQPCFDLTQISTLISHLCAGLFSSISLLFAWRAVCVEFISCSPLNN